MGAPLYSTLRGVILRKSKDGAPPLRETGEWCDHHSPCVILRKAKNSVAHFRNTGVRRPTARNVRRGVLASWIDRIISEMIFPIYNCKENLPSQRNAPPNARISSPRLGCSVTVRTITILILTFAAKKRRRRPFQTAPPWGGSIIS